MRDITLLQLYEEGARPLTGKGTVTARPASATAAGAEQAVRGTSSPGEVAFTHACFSLSLSSNQSSERVFLFFFFGSTACCSRGGVEGASL